MLNAGGISTLGTALAQVLPDGLTNNPMPDGKPWGKRNSTNTNYYLETPDTGVTRYYDFTVSKTRCAPDGVEIDCLLANNQFPGPTIEANWGDWIEVKVHNNLSDAGTAMHWHGILQKDAQWMDGVPGYTQCPIAPGEDYTYRFRADLYGTSWWHAHYSAQYGSGLVGPMVIYGPKNEQDDLDLGPVMLQDWFHTYYQEEVDGLFNEIPNAIVPRGDSNTINGKGSYPCSKTDKKCSDDMPMATFSFQSGRMHRLRLINPSSAATQKFTIDGHRFRVIATDFVEIEPYDTDVITLGVGQRSDVLVYGTGEPTDAVYMRAFRPTSCALSNGGEEVVAAVYYEDANRKHLPDSQPGPNAYNEYCGNDPLEDTVPTYPLEATEPSVTEIVPVQLKSNGSHLVWYMGGRTMRVDYNDPMLYDVNDGQFEFDFMRNVHNYGSNKTIRFVIENTGPQPHPMHLHGKSTTESLFCWQQSLTITQDTTFRSSPKANVETWAPSSGRPWAALVALPRATPTQAPFPSAKALTTCSARTPVSWVVAKQARPSGNSAPAGTARSPTKRTRPDVTSPSSWPTLTSSFSGTRTTPASGVSTPCSLMHLIARSLTI